MPNGFRIRMLLYHHYRHSCVTVLGPKPIEIIKGWYDGFWSLLEFGMQKIILIIITGFAIALSPTVNNGIAN